MQSLKTLNTKISPITLRRHILSLAYTGNTVHIGCAFSIVEIVAALYSSILRLNPKDPTSPDRDYMILSKGHGVMAVYAAYRELGWLSQKDMDQYFKDGSLLHGLCEPKLPGLEVVTGSLGHGLPIAVGMAYGLKRLGKDQSVYCIVGDGEANEGTIWEALLFAAQHKLSNLTVIIDANGFQAMGDVESILNMEPFRGKFESFGFETKEVNGHDVAALETAMNQFKKSTNQAPKALVARTSKGHGVSFTVGNDWHYKRLTPQTMEAALAELSAQEKHDA